MSEDLSRRSTMGDGTDSQTASADSADLKVDDSVLRENGHSPLPWAYYHFTDDDVPPHPGLIGSIETADGWSAAVVWADVPELPALANAEFIVRACNAHEELLAALKLYVAHFGDPLKVAHVAIAKAEDR